MPQQWPNGGRLALYFLVDMSPPAADTLFFEIDPWCKQVGYPDFVRCHDCLEIPLSWICCDDTHCDFLKPSDCILASTFLGQDVEHYAESIQLTKDKLELKYKCSISGWYSQLQDDDVLDGHILSDIGLAYKLQCQMHDQVQIDATSKILTLPQQIQLDGEYFLRMGFTADQYYAMLQNCFNELRFLVIEDNRTRIMGIVLKPWLVSRPEYLGGLRKFLQYVKKIGENNHGDVWMCTTNELYAHIQTQLNG